MMNYEFHPIANIFPMMPAADVQELAADIEEKGLHHPITLFEGKVLDGRNRLRACEMVDVEPYTTTFPGNYAEALAHVWSENVQRRHLTSGQIAACDAKRLTLEEEYAELNAKRKAEAKKRQKANLKQGDKNNEGPVVQRIGRRGTRDSKTGAIRAKAAGTNLEYITQADKIAKEAPELLDEVISGEKTLPAASRELRGEVIERGRAKSSLEKAKAAYLQLDDDDKAAFRAWVEESIENAA